MDLPPPAYRAEPPRGLLEMDATCVPCIVDYKVAVMNHAPPAGGPTGGRHVRRPVRVFGPHHRAAPIAAVPAQRHPAGTH